MSAFAFVAMLVKLVSSQEPQPRGPSTAMHWDYLPPSPSLCWDACRGFGFHQGRRVRKNITCDAGMLGESTTRRQKTKLQLGLRRRVGR